LVCHGSGLVSSVLLSNGNNLEAVILSENSDLLFVAEHLAAAQDGRNDDTAPEEARVVPTDIAMDRSQDGHQPARMAIPASPC
jgi:hypothetical protein